MINRHQPVGDTFLKIYRLNAVTAFVMVISLLALTEYQVLGFHLSFGHRLFKSAPNPQLNPASSLIRPIECRNANNRSEVGICMFSIDCMQNKGVPLSVCKHNYFVGTCCKLPDYNNFVGIVYDLRDTEMGNLLESRKASTSSSSPSIPIMSTGKSSNNNRSAQLILEQSIQTTLAPSANGNLSAIGGIQGSSNYQRVQAQDHYQHNLLTAPDTSASEQQVDSLKKRPTQNDDFTRYIISSTNLFPAQNSVSSEQIASSGQQHEVSTIRLTQPTPVPVQLSSSATGSSESARNVDGSLTNQQQQPVVVPSELDSFQIQTTLASPLFEQPLSVSSSQVNDVKLSTGSPSSSEHLLPLGYAKPSSAAYELIKDGDSSNLEVLSTINSAHSSVASLPAAMLNMLDASSQHYEAASTSTTTASKVQSFKPQDATSNEVEQHPSYQLIEEQPGGKPAQNIIFANNHQHSSSSLRPEVGGSSSYTSTIGSSSSSKQASSVPTSDQEFTLSTVSLFPTTQAQQTNPQTTSSEEQQVVSSAQTSLSSPDLSSSMTTAETLTPQLQDTSSFPLSWTVDLASSSAQSLPQFTDLVSSASTQNSQQHSSSVMSRIQTTTPFTTSLSTALLPNVSGHPFLPTEAPSSDTQLVENQSKTRVSQQQAEKQPQQSFLPGSISESKTTHHPVVSSPGHLMVSSSSAGHAQLSTTSIRNSETTPSQPTSSSFGQLYSSTAHEQQQQQLATRGPSAMGGYPSLIHQAATSKIVSSTSGSSANNLIPGLSGLQSAILSHIPFKLASGLSSGLSSYLQAAMKPNGALGRPLISSNTAPALQFQQTVASTSAGSAPPPPVSTPRPGSGHTFPSPQGAGGGSIRFPSSASEKPVTAISGLTGNSTSSVSSISVSPAPMDSQLVCGRPQATQMLNSPAQTAASADASSAANLLRRRVGRIVGGNQSMFGQWPWMVSLRQWRKGAFLHKCGAALLNERWAITAAHCVENVKASDLLLRLGEFDVSSQEEPYPYVERRVRQVVSHPSFDSKTFEYDLALLRFAEPIRYERNIVPVCVPSGNDSYVDRMATVIGWGRLYEDGPLPDVIQHVDVPIITNNECEKMYKNAGYIEEIPNMFICAGISKGGRDSCEGDSGGPLTMVDHDGRSYLVGIISWGIGCALPSQPGVYTRITAFSGWINQIISN